MGLNGTPNGHPLPPGPVNRLVNIDPPPLRLPPHNLEAERGVLGSLLPDNVLIAPVRAFLGPGDFFRDAHQVVYRAILVLADAGCPVDIITLESDLSRRDLLDKAGGADAIHDVPGWAPRAANALHYAGIVLEASRSRRLLDLAADLDRGIYGGPRALESSLAKVRASLDEFSAPSLSGGPPARPATLADVRDVVSESRWMWTGWIVEGHLALLAAEPGIGKTRTALDLCRRIYNCEPWPDGQLASRPLHTPSLWVPADRNHSELAHAAREMGLPDEAIFLNAPPGDPLGGLKLDEPASVAALARWVEAVRPGLIVIDTINKATRRLLYRPEEVEAFFGPLLDVAMRTSTPILALTHLSKGGDPLDRRIEGVCRTMWKLESPSPGGERRRLQVTKSNSVYPPPLGVTMQTEGNEYDSAPPPSAAFSAGPAPAGRPAKALQAAVEWLRLHLSDGPAYCRPTIEAALEAGIAKTTLFRARDRLRVVMEGEKGNQFFRLPAPGEASATDDFDDDAEDE